MPERTIFITGASGGLGTKVTRYFLEKGWRVIATIIDESERQAFPSDPRLDLRVVDLSDETEAANLIENVLMTPGSVDASLLLVGGYASGSVRDTRGADLKRMWSLNFEATYYVARPLFLHMMERGSGRIVLVGARPALVPAQGKQAVAYALSKSLLFRLAELFNAEAGERNVVTHVVVPSTIDTPANRKSMPDADFSAWVSPEQLSAVFYMACSEVATPLRDPVWKVYNQA